MRAKAKCSNEQMSNKLKAALEVFGLKNFEFVIVPEHGVRVLSESFTENHLKVMFKITNRYNWVAHLGACASSITDTRVKFFCAAR